MTKSSLACSASASSTVANISTSGIKRGPWTPQEDRKLFDFIQRHGHGNWSSLPEKAGLQRCGKSCRLRWRNYLRPDIKRGNFNLQEDQTIIQLHALLGNKWSAIAKNLPKRTDNEIKNYWNTHLKKRLAKIGFDPVTHKPKSGILGSACGDPKNLSNLSHIAQWESARLQAEARFADRSKLLIRDQFPAGLGCYEPQQTFSSAKPEPPMPQCLEIDDFAPWEALIMSNSLVQNGGSGGHEVSSFGNIFDGALGNIGDQFIVKSPALSMPCETGAGMKYFDGVQFEECGNNDCSELLEAVLLQHNCSSNSTGLDIGDALAFAQSDNNICGDDQNVNVGDRLSNMCYVMVNRQPSKK